MKNKKRTFLIVIFFCVALVGLVQHIFERGGGSIGGGPVSYSYNYGRAYSWEKDYDSLSGILKGRFPETKCGSLYLDTFEWKTRRENESNKYISSENCKIFMSLEEFTNRYFNKIKVGELIVKYEIPTEEQQILMFNEWKSKGLLEDIRYKDVTIYDRSNIFDFIRRVLVFPMAGACIAWLFLRKT